MENLTQVSEEYIEDLCEKYGINAQDAIDCINNAVRSYLGNVAVSTDKKDGNIDMNVYRILDFKKIDLTAIEEDKIKKISKLFHYYLNIAKYNSLYNGFKHLKGSLAFGNLTLATDAGYNVEIDRNHLFNIPQDSNWIYPYSLQPIPERNTYKGGDYLSFIVVHINRISGGNLEFVLSRTSLELPARIIENEIKISGIKTLMRLPGVITKLKTELNIPQKTIDYARELLRGEKIYVKKVR